MTLSNDARLDVLGVPVSVVTLERAADTIGEWARAGAARMVTAPDVSNIVRAQDDAGLMAVHRTADLVCPDGMPLVWLGRLAGLPIARACGPDLMQRLLATPDAHLRHYLYGGVSGVAETIARRSAASITGFATPPFHTLSEAELDLLVADIAVSGANIVWIGISTPQQEMLMQRLKPRLAAVIIAVGAAFDFSSGRVTRAPGWMQRAGLEWLHRLRSEPRRLWRRYLVLAPRFVWLVFRRFLRPGA